MPQTAKYGIGQFLPWKHWHMKFTGIGLFKFISSALTIFPRMFECPDKFIPFTPYLFVSCMIFLNFDGSLLFGLPLHNQHGDPQFFSHFFKWYTHIDILWKFYKNHYRYICPKLAQVWPLCHRQPNMVLAFFLPAKQWREQKNLSKSFLAQW